MKLFKLHKMTKSQIVLVALLVIVIQSSILTVSCRPSDRDDRYNVDEEQDDDALTPMEEAGIKRCEEDETQMELCARCTKATKARNVYPMCCLNEDGVGDWCKDFVYFGIQ